MNIKHRWFLGDVSTLCEYHKLKSQPISDSNILYITSSIPTIKKAFQRITSFHKNMLDSLEVIYSNGLNNKSKEIEAALQKMKISFEDNKFFGAIQADSFIECGKNFVLVSTKDDCYAISLEKLTSFELAQLLRIFVNSSELWEYLPENLFDNYGK